MTLVRLRQLHQDATPGPWEAGDPWNVAGVMDQFGEGRCAYCALGHDLVDVGMRDINGRQMAAHVHRTDKPYSAEHVITAGPDATVAGNYDYDAGGIIESADAALIVEVRNALPALLDVAEAAAAVDAMDEMEEWRDDPDYSELRALREALQRLDGKQT